MLLCQPLSYFLRSSTPSRRSLVPLSHHLKPFRRPLMPLCRHLTPLRHPYLLPTPKRLHITLQLLPFMLFYRYFMLHCRPLTTPNRLLPPCNHHLMPPMTI